jgi:starvation-inducible DNA-binding protein
MLGRVLKQLHWNITGPGFRPIHQHLDEIYAFVEEGIDDVAERLVATGHAANGRVEDVAKNAEIDDAPMGFISDREVLLIAEHSLKEVVQLVRSRMADIEERDTATADMLHQIALGLEKQHWMIQAQRV